MTKIQKCAGAFGALFLLVFALTNIPAFNDAEGKNFGLFAIDPIDNVVHFLTAVLGGIAAWKSVQWSRWFLVIFGVLYMADAGAGMFFQRGLLDTSLFTQPGGSPDFGLTNWLLNVPHIGIAGIMIWLGLTLDRSRA
jgi:hypothetical protein